MLHHGAHRQLGRKLTPAKLPYPSGLFAHLVVGELGSREKLVGFLFVGFVLCLFVCFGVFLFLIFVDCYAHKYAQKYIDLCKRNHEE